MHVLALYFSTVLAHSMMEVKNTKKRREQLNLSNGPKSLLLTLPKGLLAVVSPMTRECVTCVSVSSLKNRTFPIRNACRNSSSVRQSHGDDKHLQAVLWRTLEIRQGWYPSKVSEMSAKSSQPYSGLMLLSSMPLSLSAQGRTLQATIKSTEVVAGEVGWSGSMESVQYCQDLLATLRWPAPGICTCCFSTLLPLSMSQSCFQGNGISMRAKLPGAGRRQRSRKERTFL